jgi:DNA-directed RNA polymerase specialized sigma24 family protein
MTSDPKRSQAMPVDGPGNPPVCLETLYLAHSAALRGRLLALTRDPAVADDLASEAFLRLAVELAAGRAPDARAWLYRVGSNLVVSRARRRTSRRERCLDSSTAICGLARGRGHRT